MLLYCQSSDSPPARLFRLGPIGSALKGPGGYDVRGEEVKAYPILTVCSVMRFEIGLEW